MEEWFVLVNPASGSGKTAEKWPAIDLALRNAGIGFQSEFSQSPQHATVLVKEALNNGFKKMIAVGGDGTMNMLINGLFAGNDLRLNDITVGIIPMGTGNDWIRTHRIPKSITGAVDVIRKGRTISHDVGRIMLRGTSGERVQYFLNVAGFGFQGLVAERIEGISSKMKKGTSAFVRGLFDALFKFHAAEMMIQIDGISLHGDVFNLNVGICKYCGGGMKVTPDAIPGDGWFDITLIKKLSKGEVIINVPRLFNGSFVKYHKVRQYRAKKISFVSDPLIPAECDGEVLGYGNAEVEIIRNAVQAIVR
jgi:diacylglycerol kinase (ATP)